jgi:cell division protein FtsZ
MGTAIRSGENRAVEAAQAAMASPLLEAGAIDGARGILINITGSSSLKLSEVNAASSLIQSAAHEDANIIFGAVLDERMDEDVKITVIATGFRDQMPERRARMLTVEEAPVVSVPLVASGNWMSETAPATVPAQPRFLSEAEEDSAETHENSGKFLFAAATPNVATAVSVATPDSMAASVSMGDTSTDRHNAAPQETAQFNSIESEPDFKTPPRDYVGDFMVTPHDSEEEHAPVQAQAVESSLFPETSSEPERDLDVPTFLRRLNF